VNITIQSLRPIERGFTRSEALLAAKLEAAATGAFPKEPRMVYLVQARALAENPQLTQSVIASLVHLQETQ